MIEIVRVSQNLETGALEEVGFPVSNGMFIASLAIIALTFIAFYVLRAIGLFTLAKRAGLKCKIMAIFPLVWVYVACKLIGKQRFFNKTFEKVALLLCLLFSIIGFLTFAYDLICYFPIIGNVLEGRTIYLSNSTLGDGQYVQTMIRGIYGDSTFVNPYDNRPVIYLICVILHYLTTITGIISTVISILIYFNLFRKYWPQHFILAMIMSVLGLFGVFVFVIRKKEPIDYATYMKEKYKNMYGGYAGPYGYRNPYQSNNYGGQSTQNQTPPSQKSPFEDFEDKKKDPGDPFDEFK